MTPLRILSSLILALAAHALADSPLEIGFLQTSAGKPTAPHNAAALAFAESVGQVSRLCPVSSGGWQDDRGALHALEESGVIWWHQGDATAGPNLFNEATREDLRAYLDGGGVLLLSGAAGRLLNDLNIEPTPLRVLGVSGTPVVSGIRVVPKLRDHAAFAGLDTSKPVLLTSQGCNALVDFYGTAGPHGELLADGGGPGERPLVEYRAGEGRAIFVGWRLADFTTAKDAYRPNLEKLFGNLLRYLAAENHNRARLAVPKGKFHYVRLLGSPFLKAEKPEALSLPAGVSKSLLQIDAGAPDQVRESPMDGESVQATALAVTASERKEPVAHFIAQRRAEQDKMDRNDREAMGGLRVIMPQVKLLPAPLKATQMVTPDRSVLLGRSPFMTPGDGLGDVAGPVYEPVEDGGFQVTGGTRRFNRPIVHGQNRVWTGDVPVFRMDTVTGNGSYAKDERVFPLWDRPDAHIGNVNPCMGTLRIGVPGPDGKTEWLDERKGIGSTFRPGYTDYQAGDARVIVAPALDFHGFVCRVEFAKETPLLWRYGGIWWQPSEAKDNRVIFAEGMARITQASLPNGLVLAGWDGGGAGRAIPTSFGQEAEFSGGEPRKVYHLAAVWGVTKVDQARLTKTLARLDTENAGAWPEKRDELKRLWSDCYVSRALEPEKHLRMLLFAPADELGRTQQWWDKRRAEFQIRTPDRHLNALINWARCISEYHRQGPGLVLGGQIWQMYSHISTGWYGKQWGGDHAAMEQCLRFYGAMQGNDGFIRWISPSLVAFHAENNTPYWVDQVWRHYTWTGDRQFVQDMWPIVRKAVAWMRTHNDPDGDGLFRDFYEYWNGDSNGKGPKSAAPSAMSWAMLDRAARMAEVVGDSQAAVEYRKLADESRAAVFAELWNEAEGRLGCIGADGIWRGHPQTWEEYLAVNAGLLSPDQARRAMRWIESHYGFEPKPGVKLLACSDWWPIRWSCQWVPTGDSCLAVLAGMKSGDPDLWWPYLRTVVGSSFRSECPGINMGIGNSGAGGGDREDVDSDDPHAHSVVRGLFGIEPALHEGRLDICPAFPSDWKEASIRTPDISYDWKRDGKRCNFRIHTPKPLVKRVRGGAGGGEIVTPVETESVVTVTNGPAEPPRQPAVAATILAEQQPAPAVEPQSVSERGRLILFDLKPTCNVTNEELVATRFIFDYADSPSALGGWWGNPSFAQAPSSRVVEAPNGVRFLTSGRPQPGAGSTPKNLLALASWRPFPLPGGAEIPVGARCERVWLLLQGYVHPMKNYLTNGEVILHYADGKTAVTPLIPPFNLDAYFQHFSREGVPVPLGQTKPTGRPFDFVAGKWIFVHADALPVACDPSRELAKVELRATCSEAVIGLAGMTAVAAKP